MLSRGACPLKLNCSTVQRICFGPASASSVSAAPGAAAGCARPAIPGPRIRRKTASAPGCERMRWAKVWESVFSVIIPLRERVDAPRLDRRIVSAPPRQDKGRGRIQDLHLRPQTRRGVRQSCHTPPSASRPGRRYRSGNSESARGAGSHSTSPAVPASSPAQTAASPRRRLARMPRRWPPPAASPRPPV